VKRLERLREFLEKEPSGVEIATLANALRITERSVRRYLDVLSQTTTLESIPTTPGGPHKWRIKPVERARTITLRRTQAYVILSVQRAFETWRGSALYEEIAVALDQIRAVGARAARGGSVGDAVLDGRLDERFFLLPQPARTFAGRGDDLDALFAAVAMLHPLSFRMAQKGAVPARSERPPRQVMHPYAVIEFAGSLFIVGPDAGKEEVRVVAFETISDLRTVEKNKFFIPADFDVSAYTHGAFGVATPTNQRALVEFDTRVADEIRSRKLHPAQKLFTAKDGRVRLSFPLVNRDAVATFVLGFGEAARVIEPVDFAAEIAARLVRAARRYGATAEIAPPSLPVRPPAG
jgi:predicted DNA-binding transcriptional regulator YafY